jgi:enamine deaminase RidA (YjgF/YER057c/UK114 family)
MSFCQAVKVGPFVFVSGQAGLGDDGKVPPEAVGDVAAQTRIAMENIGRLLAEAGGGYDDIVKVTTYLTDRGPGVFGLYDKTFGEYFTGGFPACTLVEAKSLSLRDMLVEIDVTAVVQGESVSA